MEEALERAFLGGLILAPSGPGLCDLEHDSHYRNALLGSDINLPDSGLAILLMRLLGLGNPHRVSGLGFLDQLLHSDTFRSLPRSCWIMPTPQAMNRNLDWLCSQGLLLGRQDCYIAPLYPRSGAVEDDRLFGILMEKKPPFIFICTGSGTQEKLGYWLKRKLPYTPTICCIGAAIGFLSGDQVSIPRWADRLCLGWFLRCLAEPSRFVPRYLRALRLILLVFRHREMPPLISSRV